MLELDQIRALLSDRRLSIVSKETGLHYNTIKEIRDGVQTNPSYRTIHALSAYFTKAAHANA
jgi:hypothetical protein